MTNASTFKAAAIAAGATLLTLTSGLTARAATFLSTANGVVGAVSADGTFNPVVTGAPTFYDIALSPSNRLVGVATDGSFHQINPAANSVTALGGGGTFLNALGYSSDGTLYGAGGSGFYRINLDGATPVVSLIATIAGFSSAGDVVFDAPNNRFLATSSSPSNSSLFSIGLNGTSNAIGAIGFTNVLGLAFNDDGSRLLGYTYDQQQITVDPTTGAGVFDRAITGATGGIFGAASSPIPPAAAVPEPASMLGLLAAGGLGAILRRQKQA